MNKQTVLVYLLLLCSMYSLHAQNIDLELSLSTPNPNPANYSHVPLTYTISNNGTATATNIRMDVRVCDPLLDYPAVFNNPTQVVNSTSPPHVTSVGTYDKVRHAWFIPSLAAGSSATLNLTIFILTEEERTLFGTVSEVDQTDVDSSPNSLSVCSISEDDEAELVLNGGTTPSCDIQNLAWVDARIADEEGLCAECIDFIKIYEVDEITYIGFIADNENCSDVVTTIYNCDGTVFCQDGGVAGLSECEDWWAQNPSESYQLWTGNCFEDIGFGTIGAFAWFDYNGNGIREEGVDTPLPGMQVQLEDNNNNIVGNEIIGTIGQGYFYNVPTGTYRLVFEGLDGAVPTLKFASGSTDFTNSAINSDGKTDFFTLGINENISYVGGGFYDSSSNTTTDLELSLEVSNPNPNAYTHVPVTYTVENRGTSAANNIRIWIGTCVNGSWTFTQNNGIVHSSTTPSTSAGAYSKTSQVWSISSLAPGTSATLDLSVFMLSDEERPLVGQVVDASPNDMDSSPDNMTGCMAAEDDEVNVILNEGTPVLCDYENLTWLNDILADSEGLCDDCIRNIVVYKIGQDTYIGFNADNNNCDDALTTIYNCDGTVYCEEGGIQGLEECNDWRDSNPSAIEVLWSTIQNCNVLPASISTLAWLDQNGDGIREEGIDNTLSNVAVDLENEDGQIVGTGQTNANGQVSFYPLDPGTYRLVYAAPNGTQPTIKNAPGSTPSTDNEINPDGTSDYLTVGSAGIINNLGAGFFSGSQGDDIDLELSLNASNPFPSPYTHVPLTYTVRNTGAGTATNIGISIGVCPVPSYHSSGFRQENGIVNSSPSPSTSQGVYNSTSQTWEIEELAAGASATLDLTVFTLTNEERFLIGHVFRAAPHDVDSTPSSSGDCAATEDDEVNVALNGDSVCTCEGTDAPVCGSDGVTYNNACWAECAGIFNYTSGACGMTTCEEDCPTNIAPVCGSDGVTYDNGCLAECAGIFDYTSGECTTGGDGVDLELEIIPPSSYAIYTNMTFQVRVFNNGTTNAENVVVDAPLPDGFVHSSNSATSGEYDLFREEWGVGTIKVGETAVLDLNLFALTSDEITAYAQVAAAEPNDIDSTPGNGTCCTANEDDEDAITISSNFQGDNGSTGFVAPSSSKDLDIKNIYPSIATDEITIFVQSKLSELNLRVYNLQGHELLQQKYQDTEGFQRLPLDVSELPTGTYLIRFDGSLGRETLRFVKMKM